MSFKNSKEKREMRKLRKVSKRVLSAFMMTTLITGIPNVTTLAAREGMVSDLEESNIVEILHATLIEEDRLDEILLYTMLADCIITVSGDSDGMHIDITTGVVGTASILGVKDIKVQKKTWYGGWTTVAVSDGKEVKDRSTMGINLLYRNAEKDATYRITCIHYGDVDGYIEGENNSGEIIFTY